MSERNGVAPCPFCGGDCDPTGWLSGDGVRGPECESCGATAASVEDWNRRFERDQLRAEVEMLREDAERWRYVSLQGDDTHWLNLLRVDLEDFGGNINAAVDALIDGEAPAMAAKEA